MKETIYHQILFHAAQTLERPQFSVLHRFIRHIYLKLTVPLVSLICNFGGEEILSVVARHSSTSADNFHFLLSDLDLSIYTKNTEPAELKRILERLKFLKRFLPFIGEVEIYTEAEKARLAALLNDFGPLYKSLRDLRKIGWMEISYRDAPSRYHQMKALRAIGFSLKRLGMPGPAAKSNNLTFAPAYFRNLLVSRFPELRLNSKGAFSGEVHFSVYLGFWLSDVPAPAHDSIPFDFETAAFALAISPTYYPDESRLGAAIRRFRANAKLHDTLSALTEIEFLIFQAVYRAHLVHADWMPLWLSSLRSGVEFCKKGMGDNDRREEVVAGV